MKKPALLNPYDIGLGLVLLLLAAALLLGPARPQQAAAAGASLVLSREGEVFAVYPLDQEAAVDLEWRGHHNRLVISQGQAYIEEADCPDQYCVLHPPVRYQRETIVCLPARLVATVTGGETGALDAVSQ